MENIERNHSAPAQTGPNVLNRWVHGDLMTVHDLALNHTEHSSMYQRNENVWKDFPATQKGDYDRDDGMVGYAWMARYTWKFLDAYLKNDSGAMAFLKRAPAENGVPKQYMTPEFRPAAVWRLRWFHDFARSCRKVDRLSPPRIFGNCNPIIFEDENNTGCVDKR
jgi:hypothetical protein